MKTLLTLICCVFSVACSYDPYTEKPYVAADMDTTSIIGPDAATPETVDVLETSEGVFAPRIFGLDNDDPTEVLTALGYYSRLGSLVRASYVLEWVNRDDNSGTAPLDVSLPFEYLIGQTPAHSGEIADYYSSPLTNGRYVPVITYYDSTEYVRIRHITDTGQLGLPSDGFRLGSGDRRRLRFTVVYRTNGNRL